MKYEIFIIILAVFKESHPLNPEILKYDEFMKDFETTGRRLKQETAGKEMVGSPVNKRESGGSNRSNEEASFNLTIYREVLQLTSEQLRKQKIHIDEIKKSCDWLLSNGIELKRLPQIVYHASKLLGEEANKTQEKIDSDIENEEKSNPFSPALITRIKNFHVEIKKFIHAQTTLTSQEIETFERELSVAEEELKVACQSIGEKITKIEKFLSEKQEIDIFR